jgi:hypothetical protein
MDEESENNLSAKLKGDFFAEYELRELGAVDSKDRIGDLVLGGIIYEPRGGDYYVSKKKYL